MGRWLSLKESAHEHAKAMAAGLLHQKRCHEKDAGPYCIAGPSGTGRAAEFLTWFLALCYGGYASGVAIETPGGDDDQQWLTFWLMFVGAMFLEETCARVLLSRFPLYYEVKLNETDHHVNLSLSCDTKRCCISGSQENSFQHSFVW